MSYIAWADGGNNPSTNSDAACAAVISDKDMHRVIGKYIGNGTNNIAELHAVKMVLEDYIKVYGYTSRPPVIYSDSQYCVGMLTKRSDVRHNVDIFKKRYEAAEKRGDYVKHIKLWNLNPVGNTSLIEEIRSLVVQTHASLVWVRGHAICQENIVADQVVQICK